MVLRAMFGGSNWEEVLGPSGPPPTKLVDDLQGQRPSSNENSNSSGTGGSSDLDRKIAGILERFDDSAQSIENLQRKQDEMAAKFGQFCQKQDEADLVRRKQIDCISTRVFEAEKQLSESHHLQDDAIAKANAVFEKHAGQVEQERQNLMSVIGQVNRNFEHLSGEIAQHGNIAKGSQQDFMKMQMDFESLNENHSQLWLELRSQSSAESCVQPTLAALKQALHELQAQVDHVVAEQEKVSVTLCNQQEELTDVHARVEDAREARALSATNRAQEQRLAAATEESYAAEADLDDLVAAERAAPEPTALARPAFCSRPALRRFPETVLGNNQVNAGQLGPGFGAPFGAPHGLNPDLWRGQVGQETQAMRGNSVSSQNVWRQTSPSPEVAQQRQSEAWHNDPGPDESDSELESSREEWAWGMDQPNGTLEDPGILQWNVQQYHSSGVPPKTMPDFARPL